jgi:hypothetical protein
MARRMSQIRLIGLLPILSLCLVTALRADESEIEVSRAIRYAQHDGVALTGDLNYRLTEGGKKTYPSGIMAGAAVPMQLEWVAGQPEMGQGWPSVRTISRLLVSQPVPASRRYRRDL